MNETNRGSTSEAQFAPSHPDGAELQESDIVDAATRIVGIGATALEDILKIAPSAEPVIHTILTEKVKLPSELKHRRTLADVARRPRADNHIKTTRTTSATTSRRGGSVSNKTSTKVYSNEHIPAEFSDSTTVEIAPHNLAITEKRKITVSNGGVRRQPRNLERKLTVHTSSSEGEKPKIQITQVGSRTRSWSTDALYRESHTPEETAANQREAQVAIKIAESMQKRAQQENAKKGKGSALSAQQLRRRQGIAAAKVAKARADAILYSKNG